MDARVRVTALARHGLNPVAVAAPCRCAPGSAEPSGLRRPTRLELSGVALHEVTHLRRCFAGEFAQGVRHAVVTPLPGQLGHGREMPDDVLRIPRLPKAFAPRREWDVVISDGPAERVG